MLYEVNVPVLGPHEFRRKHVYYQ